MKRNNNKGFTLVELVIVIAVIAILAAVLIPTFGNIIDKANNSAALQEARNTFSQALIEDYKITEGTVYVQVGKENNIKYVVFVNGEPVDTDKDGDYTNEAIPENLELYSDKAALSKIYKTSANTSDNETDDDNTSTDPGLGDDTQDPTDPGNPDEGNDNTEELTKHFFCFDCNDHMDLDIQYVNEHSDEYGNLACPRHPLSALYETNTDECYACKQ